MMLVVRTQKKAFWLIGILAPLFLCFPAQAEDGSTTLIRKSAEALESGRVSEAIGLLEGAADRGMRHPELSFNRALAYQKRIGTAQERAGDRGQAAAGFAEVLSLRPEDVEAERGLEEAQLAVARRNSKRKKEGAAQVSAPLGLVERALLAIPPQLLFWLGLAGSLTWTLSLVLRRFRSEGLRLPATVGSGLGAFLLVTSAGLYFLRASLFAEARMAVIVAPSAHLVDEAGRAQPGRGALAESTLVFVGPAQRGLVPMVGLANQDFLSVAQLRFVSDKPL